MHINCLKEASQELKDLVDKKEEDIVEGVNCVIDKLNSVKELLIVQK